MLLNKKRDFVVGIVQVELPAPHTMAKYLEANGSGSIRFEAERLAHAAKVMKEDTFLLERLAEQQEGWN